MHEPIPSMLPADLAAACKRFLEWRTVRRIGARIPEPLWQSAAELAKSCGVSRLSQTLQVDYYSLRWRIDPTFVHCSRSSDHRRRISCSFRSTACRLRLRFVASS